MPKFKCFVCLFLFVLLGKLQSDDLAVPGGNSRHFALLANLTGYNLICICVDIERVDTGYRSIACLFRLYLSTEGEPFVGVVA